MKKEKVYNEDISGDEGFNAGEGYPSCEGESCANVADASDGQADIMTEKADATDTPEQDKADQELEALKAEVADWKDKYIRLQAEFDNYRKRTLRERMELVQTGGREVLLAMLPVHDNVARAVAAMEKSDDLEALRSGVRMIAQQFTDTLRQQGVTAIEVADKAFDPEVAEAVAQFAAGEEKKGLVIDTVLTGYKLGDKVLRYAKVVVGE